MDEPKTALVYALCHRHDSEALELIKSDPDLIDEDIIGLALDHGCVKVIRYLRHTNKITMAGKAGREQKRLEEFNAKINRFNDTFAEIEKHLK